MISTAAAVLAGAALFSTILHAAWTAGLAGLLSALAGAGAGLAVLAVLRSELPFLNALYPLLHFGPIEFSATATALSEN